ncbi:MAG: glycosyltransferase [Nitrosomonadales bacterium]|nr:glycosyltransferase [Nitrosomonadales bacterium]
MSIIETPIPADLVEKRNAAIEGGLRTKNQLRQRTKGKPLIAVITVAFNGAATLECAILSVLQQTYDNVEHIIIDGGSTDGTTDILRKYDDRLDYWVSEKDAGIYDAMNKGLALASGDVVGFLNADDFYADASVLEQVASAFGDGATEACYADLVYVHPVSLGTVRYWRSEPFRSGMFAAGWCPPHPTFYVRKAVVDRCGGFDLSFRLAADAEFMLRYLEGNHVRTRYVPGVWVKMRLGGQTNQSWANIVRQNREIIRALRMHGIPVSYVRFIASKLLNRIIQFVRAKTGP